MECAKFDRSLSVERQITAHVRGLVNSGVLAEGMRVPPIRALAETWESNYFTVQTALRSLVREGLLVQSPRLGTFVAQRKKTLRRACLYHGEDLKFKGGSEFGGRLHMEIYRLLAVRGIQTVSHFDHRPAKERGQMPSEIRQLIKDRQVDAVISSTHHESWLDELDVPMASLEKSPGHGEVNWDVGAFVRLSMDAIRQSGARRICVIDRKSTARASLSGEMRATMKQSLETEIAAAGLAVVPSPDFGANMPHRGMEETGFLIGEKIAAMASPPDAMVIFPDTYTRGVVSALLKHGVRVPEDMRLISHRNREISFFTPLPVVWLTVSIADYAEALLLQIEQQMAGAPVSRISIHVSVEQPSEDRLSTAGARRRKTK